MLRTKSGFWSVCVGRSLLVLSMGLALLLTTSQALAQMRPLTQEELSTFLDGKRNAMLGVIKRDGSPQVNPMGYRWDGEKFWISTTKDRAKYKNLMRDPRMTLAIEDAATLTAVIASGKAVITEENLWEETTTMLERYMGAEGAAGYVKKMQKDGERRVLLVLKPEKIISWTRVTAPPPQAK